MLEYGFIYLSLLKGGYLMANKWVNVLVLDDTANDILKDISSDYYDGLIPLSEAENKTAVALMEFTKRSRDLPVLGILKV